MDLRRELCALQHAITGKIDVDSDRAALLAIVTLHAIRRSGLINKVIQPTNPSGVPTGVLDVFLYVTEINLGTHDIGFRHMRFSSKCPFSGECNPASLVSAHLTPQVADLIFCPRPSHCAIDSPPEVLANVARQRVGLVSAKDVRFALCGVARSMAQRNDSLKHRWALFDEATMDGARQFWLRRYASADAPICSVSCPKFQAAANCSRAELQKAFAAADTSDIAALDRGTRLGRRALRRLILLLASADELQPVYTVNTLEAASSSFFLNGTASNLAFCLFAASAFPFRQVLWSTSSLNSGLFFNSDIDLFQKPGDGILFESDTVGKVRDSYPNKKNIRGGRLPNCIVPPDLIKCTNKTSRFLRHIGISHVQIARILASPSPESEILYRWSRAMFSKKQSLTSEDLVSSRSNCKSSIEVSRLPSKNATPHRRVIPSISNDQTSFHLKGAGERAGAAFSAESDLLLYAATKRERVAKWRSNRIGILVSNRTRLKSLLDADARVWISDLRASMGERNPTFRDNHLDLQSRCTSHEARAKRKDSEFNGQVSGKLMPNREDSNTVAVTGSYNDLIAIETDGLKPYPPVRAERRMDGYGDDGEAATAGDICHVAALAHRVWKSNGEKFVPKKLPFFSNSIQIMPFHMSSRRNVLQLLGREISCVKGASASVLLDSDESLLEQCFVLRQHVLGGAARQSELFLTLLVPRHGILSTRTIMQKFLSSMDEAGWTREEGECRLHYDSIPCCGGANTIDTLAHVAVKYVPPSCFENFFEDIHAYTTLHAWLLLSNHARMVLSEPDHPRRLVFKKLFSRDTRKAECFRHEVRFVVNALDAYATSCIERAWRCFLCNFDASDHEAVAESHRCFLSSLSRLSAIELETKFKNVLQFATDAKDVSSRIEQTRVGFFAVLHDLILGLDSIKDPTALDLELVDKLTEAFTDRRRARFHGRYCSGSQFVRR